MLLGGKERTHLNGISPRLPFDLLGLGQIGVQRFPKAAARRVATDGRVFSRRGEK